MAAGTTTCDGSSADIGSLAGLSNGLAAPGGVPGDGAASTGFMFGPAARAVRLPFDSIPLILVSSSRAVLRRTITKIDDVR